LVSAEYGIVSSGYSHRLPTREGRMEKERKDGGEKGKGEGSGEKYYGRGETADHGPLLRREADSPKRGGRR
jgi:hypothetical protein